MSDSATSPASGAMRPLGRGRSFTAAELPARFAHWHAARANRWERLVLDSGHLVTAWLEEAGTTRLELGAGQTHWIAPGRRWRILAWSEDVVFSVQMHADDSVQADAPQVERARLLDDTPLAEPTNESELEILLTRLGAGERRLLRTAFDPTDAVRAAMAVAQGRLSWHPLGTHAGQYAALLVCTAEPVDLLDYLGRDHAVIEATLPAALSGDAEREHWLRTLLARHLRIEEERLFPAYLAASGDPALIDALRREHDLLRGHLANIADPASHRGLLLVLEAHDEKEEQIVYPLVAGQLQSNAESFLRGLVATV